MRFRTVPPRTIHLVLLICILAACQASPTAVEQTRQPTGFAPTRTAPPEQISPTLTPQPSATPAPQGAASIDPATLRGADVTFWHPWMEGMSATVAELVRDFNSTNEWGIQVTARGFTTSGELYETLATTYEEEPQNTPDLIAAPGEQIAEIDSSYQAVVALDDLIHHAPVGLTEQELAAYDPAFWAQDQQDDRQLAVPYLRSAQVLFYNQTWANELGFSEPPATPEQFEQQACAAAVQNNASIQNERIGTGGWLVDTDALTLLSWIDAFGGSISAEAGTDPYTFETREAEAAVAYLRGLMDQGCAWLPRLQTRHEVFARRLALFVTGSLSDIPVQQQISTRVGGGDRWVVLPFPSEQGQPHVWSSGSSLAVLRPPDAGEDQAAHQQQLAAWLFLRWLAAPQQAAQFAALLPSLPVSSALETQLTSMAEYPGSLILPLQEAAQPAPTGGSWRMVRRFMNDAAWQVFYLPTDQAAFVLSQLDEAVQEWIEDD